MKRHKVILAPEAEADLVSIFYWIAEKGAPLAAMRYVERIDDYLQTLGEMPERGRRLPGYGDGVRVVFFENRVIPYRVVEARVEILRILYAGSNWKKDED